MMNVMRAMLEDTEGATLVEYALIVTLIAIVALIAIKTFGSNTSALLSGSAGSI